MADIINFQTQKEIKRWEKFTQRIKEICLGIGLPTTPEFLNEMTVHFTYETAKTQELKQEALKRRTIEPNIITNKVISILKNEFNPS